MRQRFLLGVIVASVIALAYGFTLNPPTAEAGGGKNLQVFPKNTSKKDLKKAMKKVSKALGVQCDFCHDMENFAKDSKHKEIARDMMRMVNSINKKYFRKSDHKVSCMTCHRGKKHPEK